VHAPVRDTPGHWPEVAAALQALPAAVRTVVVHPDLVGEDEAELLRPLGVRLCFENMDNQKADGRFPAELERVYALCPDAAFCLDVAHVWTHDPSMELAFELLDCFGERLRQVHLSGIEPDSQHRPTTFQDVARYAGAVERCGDVPVILETTLTEL
jgi:sugar phosphate isomerase/epimerase